MAPPSGLSILLEQLQDSLLVLVGLRQGGNTRLLEDLILGHVATTCPMFASCMEL